MLGILASRGGSYGSQAWQLAEGVTRAGQEPQGRDEPPFMMETTARLSIPMLQSTAPNLSPTLGLSGTGVDSLLKT